MVADLDFLEQNGDTAEASIRAGVAALRGDKVTMFAALDESLHKTISPKQLRVFPVFEDYRDDPDFPSIDRVSRCRLTRKMFTCTMKIPRKVGG